MFVESVMGLLQGNYISRGGMTQGLHVTRVRQSLYQPHSVIFFPLCGFTLFKQGHRNRLESTLCFTGVIMVNKGGTYDEWLP